MSSTNAGLLSSTRRVLILLIVFAGGLAIHQQRTLAIDAATGPLGTNVDAVQNTNTFGLLGAGQNIGQVEGGRPGDPQVMTGGVPAVAEVNHPFVNPGGAGVGVAVGNVSPPAAGTAATPNRVDDHATHVAFVMIGQNPAPDVANPITQNRGVVPSATLFSSGYQTPFPNPVPAAGPALVALVFQQNNMVLGTEWVLGQGATVVNMSFGEPINEDFNGDGVLNPGPNPAQEFDIDGDGMLTLSNAFYQPGGNARRDGMNLAALYIDWRANNRQFGGTVVTSDVVFVEAGPEQGPPSNSTPDDAYNSIIVGMTGPRVAGGRFDQIHAGQLLNLPVAQGAPPGGGISRNRIDLVAPGAGRSGFAPFVGLNLATIDSNKDGTIGDTAINTGNGANQHVGTSFAAPHVAGVATMLEERGVAQGADYSRNHLVEKATLMNSASKHVLNQAGNASWTTRYESRANSLINPTSNAQSLDTQIGTGQLNAPAALRQYQAAFGASARSDMGVRLNTVNANANSGNIALFDGKDLKRGSLVTATLTWDRTVALTAPGANLTAVASYNATVPSNLDLQLINTATNAIVYQANSTVDNSEHVYFNVPADGKYALKVVNNSAGNAVQYGLAWSAGTSDGISFSVDGGLNSLGQPVVGRELAGARPANAAEGLLAPFGANKYPNDVNALGTAGGGYYPTEGEIFTSSVDGTNIERISGALGTKSRVGPHNAPPAAETLLGTSPRGVLGLVPNDNLNSLSYGYDGTSLLGLINRPTVLLFSVDTKSVGNLGTDVFFESALSPFGGAPANSLPTNPGGGDPGGEAAGDIYVSARFAPFGKYLSSNAATVADPNSNRLYIDESELGLQAPASGAIRPAAPDDLDALEMTSPLFIDVDGDGMHGDEVFFTLDKTSPTISGGGALKARDILVSTPADANDAQFNLNPANPFAAPNKFADGVLNMGLQADDVIDALALSDVTPLISAPFFLPLTNGLMNATLDEALFSLAPGSPTLSILSLISGRNFSAADVFYTNFTGNFLVYATAEELGLLAEDNLDALDVFLAVPEPSTLLLCLIWAAALRSGRQRRVR